MSAFSIPVMIRWISRRALRWCYRELRYVGRDRVPDNGAALLFGNHPNDLPDVLAGFFTTERPLRYVATITGSVLPLANVIYRGMGVIPVTRIRDARKMRSLGHDMATVNRLAFAAVQAAFRDGDAVGVFPEGGVHDTSDVGKPRAGVARMALESFDDASISDVRLVAFGIQYEAGRVPRSDVSIVIGEPFSLREWVNSQADPSPSALSQRLHDELIAVARSSSSWPNAEARDRLIAASAAVHASSGEPLLETAARLQRRCGWLVEGRDASQDDLDAPVIHWRIVADELAEFVGEVGGIPTSARDTARVLDAAGAGNPQADWPALGWVLAMAMPASIGLAMMGPIQLAAWRLAQRMAKVRTDLVARAILPGLHLILLGYVVLSGLIALGFRAASVSAWWALPVVVLLPRLGDLGLAWRDAVRALRLRARVRRMSVAERTAIRDAADRVRSAWLDISPTTSSSQS